MTISWEEIEDSFDSKNAQQFYDFFIKKIEQNQLNCIDDISKLRLIFLMLPIEKRYQTFKLLQIQQILNNFNTKDIVDLYGIFPPEDAYQFFSSNFIISRLQTLSLSEEDREDIISYFQSAKKDSVRNLLNTHLIQPQEPNNTSDADEGYCRGFRF